MGSEKALSTLARRPMKANGSVPLDLGNMI